MISGRVALTVALGLSGFARSVEGSGVNGAWLSTHSASFAVPVTSWKAQRDGLIVKQDKDFSCGAASLATLLNGYYGQSVTEDALLEAMDKGDGRASFDDMARALPRFGFRAQGFAASWEQLTRLKVPVVVYVKHRKDDHFAVLRGISADTVWLADPSTGNRTYSKEQFLSQWQTRSGMDDAALAGKFLAVLPLGAEARGTDGYFTRAPRRQSAAAVQELTFAVRP